MKKYKIALVTANVGSFDPVFKVKEQDYECDVFYYTEKNLPFPLVNLNDRLKSKYVKIQMHRFLPDYNAYIWIDSSVEVVSEKFVGKMIEALRNNDVVISKHPERKNVYEELEYIIDSIAAGKEYLIKRYANEPLDEELTFYKNNNMPREYPLFVARFFARWNDPVVNEGFDDWWNRVLEFANFDQAMFSYIAWHKPLEINLLDYNATVREYLAVHKHS